MNLHDWLSSGDLQRQPPTREELTRLLEVAERDLADATATELSTDRQFTIAYEAAFTLATVALRAAGYRTRTGAGHHWLTFAVLPEIMGATVEARARFYQACRRKRHEATYRVTGVATAAEAEELLRDVKALRVELEGWLHERHPEVFSPG